MIFIKKNSPFKLSFFKIRDYTQHIFINTRDQNDFFYWWIETNMKWYWTIYLLDFTVWSYLCKLQSMHAWSLQRGDHSYYSLFIFSTSLVFDVLMFTFKVDFFLRNNSKLIKHIIHLIFFFIHSAQISFCFFLFLLSGQP